MSKKEVFYKSFIMSIICLLLIFSFLWFVYDKAKVNESEELQITESEITDSVGLIPTFIINKYDSSTFLLNVYPPRQSQRIYTIKKLKVDDLNFILILDQNGRIEEIFLK